MKQLLLFFYLLLMVNLSGSQLLAQNMDWANLRKYAADNERLGIPESDESRVVFMGNSITESWKIIRPTFFQRAGFINRGISGQTTPQMLLRFRPEVIDLKPKVVVLFAGTNDIAQNTGYIPLEMIAGNIKSMAELALANDIKVIICSVLPAIGFPWSPDIEPAEKIMQLNALLKSYADSNDVLYVDYYSGLVDDQGGLKVPEYTTSNDLVHPNAAGYEIMERLILEGLDKIQ